MISLYILKYQGYIGNFVWADVTFLPISSITQGTSTKGYPQIDVCVSLLIRRNKQY